MLLLLIISIVVQSITFSSGFTLQPRIINGLVTDTTNYPSFVNLRFYFHTCGGTLISDRWVLTAAHCLRRLFPVDVYLGIGPDGSFKRVMHVSVFNQYMRACTRIDCWMYDIGLLELPESIVPNEYIRPMYLPRECIHVNVGDAVTAIGNGRTQFNQPANDPILRHGFSHVLPFSECVDDLVFPSNPQSIICAKARLLKNVYKGDSGGPLFRSSDGALIGITSFSSIWEMNSYTFVDFQVFSNVAFYNEWISKITGLELPNCYQNETLEG